MPYQRTREPSQWSWRYSLVLRRRFLTCGSRLAAVLLLVFLSGCPPYPEVTSPEALHLLGAIRTACSSQSQARLERVKQAADELQQSTQLSLNEYEAFRRILEMAERGEWEEAEQACYQYQKAQLR